MPACPNCCKTDECGRFALRKDNLPGDPDDAEHNGDEPEEHGGGKEPDEVLTTDA